MAIRSDRTDGGRATPVERLDLLRGDYVQQWARSARALEVGGHYSWLVSQLPLPGGRLLEIGTGTGESTLALARAGWRVVALEENVRCLAATAARLREAGVATELVLRGQLRAARAGMHSISYEGAMPKSDAQALLIESDVLNDRGMLDQLTAGQPFDAVVCWLVGTHNAREANEAIDALHVSNPVEYRLHVQNRVYQLADKILRSGGALHVADRGQAPATAADEIAEDLLRSHRDQAEETSLVVQPSPTWRDYEEADSGGVPMMFTFPSPPTAPLTTALLSIVSIKQGSPT